MRIATCLLLLAFCSSADAQTTFQKIYSRGQTSAAIRIQKTTDGGYVIGSSCYIDSASNNDLLVIKTNPAGDTVWSRTYGTPWIDDIAAIRQTSDGGYLVAGNSSLGCCGQMKMLIIKIDGAGTVTWSNFYGGYGFSSVSDFVQTSDGGYMIAGATGDFGGGCYLLKLTGSGLASWGKTLHNSTQNVSILSIQQTTDGGYILGASSYLGGGSWEHILIRLNSAATFTWATSYTYATPDYILGNAIQTADGGYMHSCTYYSSGAGNYVYLLKTTSTGAFSWAQNYWLNGYSYVTGIAQTSDGGYVVTGQNKIVSADANAFLLKTTPAGAVSWCKTYGTVNDETGWVVRQTGDGGYVVGGLSNTSGSNYSLYVVKTNSMGNSGCNENTLSPLSSGFVPTSTSIAFTQTAGDSINAVTVQTSRGITVMDGCTVGISEQTERPSALIFPNPGGGIFRIELQSLKTFQATVYDATGKMVYMDRHFQTGNTIDLSDRKDGLYLLELKNDSGVFTSRIILQHN